MTLVLVLLALAWGQAPAPALAPPSTATTVYYNARLALREGQPAEAVHLWLLRSALENQTGRVSAHDEDFRTVTWAALGELGVCQDGLQRDEGGAGLWPVAMHNWVVRNMRRRVRGPRPRAFDALALGRQQRYIDINDVLGAQELQTVTLSRGACLRPRLALVASGELVTARLSDRQVAARLLHHLLSQARDTLNPAQVRGWAVIEARLFDLSLQLTALAAREASQRAREQAREGRLIGMGRESIEALRAAAPTTTLSPESEQARILAACVDWPTEEWMALSADRRRFLFDHARTQSDDPAALDAVALGILDTLIAQGAGQEAEQWIARLSPGAASAQVVWSGERGQRLLALDRASGFRERGVIALHRGVYHLEAGELPEALRTLAYAMQHAPDSRAADEVLRLSRRWLSFVAAQFEITDDLLITLQALVPRRDYSLLLEDLLWRAALHADSASFARGLQSQGGRDALARRLVLLEPLAAGNLRRFAQQIRDGLRDSPSETLRFLDQLVQRLELEDAEVRAAHIPTLRSIRELVLPLSTGAGGGGSLGRGADALLDRSAAILEGLGALGPGASSRDQARALDPSGEVFAGSLRLAPADPLPWPFRAEEVSAPSVFLPLQLTPREWRGPDGSWVFGWNIQG